MQLGLCFLMQMYQLRMVSNPAPLYILYLLNCVYTADAATSTASVADEDIDISSVAYAQSQFPTTHPPREQPVFSKYGTTN